ncbi:MAG: hypothetical protein MJ091_04485, partial [Clostridia bacterium]|nr:hypothetical protein [Clostridia bacterium]
MKKLVSIILAALMLMSVFSTVAFADGPVYVAEVNSNKYETLEEAIAAATTGDTVTVLSDIVVDKDVQIGKKLTLDLNGKVISASSSFKVEATGKNNGGIIGVLHGADVTIMDSSVPSTGKISSNGNCYAAVAIAPAGDTADSTTAKLTVKSGTISGDYYGVVGNGSEHRGNTEIVVAGGRIEGTHFEDNLGIFNPQENGKVTVKGGVVIGYSSGIEMRSGALLVEGGRIEATAATYSETKNNSGSTIVGAAIAVSQHGTNYPLSATITGGTIVGKKALTEVDLMDDNSSNISMSVDGGAFDGEIYSENIAGYIKSGEFTAEPTGAYVDSDSQLQSDGHGGFVVVDPTAICKYEQAVSIPVSGKKYSLKLGGEYKGKFIFDNTDSGWIIENEDGMYLGMSEGKLVIRALPYYWNYKNGMFSTGVESTVTTDGFWFLFFYIPGRTKTVTTT